jgi:predicted XRE-type DNA-binding protein
MDYIVHFRDISQLYQYSINCKEEFFQQNKRRYKIMVNQEIKNLIKKHRLFRYEVADAMGISEGYLSTLLRKSLTEEMEQRVLEAINKLTNQ